MTAKKKGSRARPAPTPIPKPEVFISWSKERSRLLALAMKGFLATTLAQTQTFMSEKDIDKGAEGFTELSARLRSAHAGMVCLTPENLNDPWILFEAGALTQTTADRVWMVLLGLKHEDVPFPLRLRQLTDLSKRSAVLHMIETINRSTGSPLEKEVLHRLFDAFFPQLEAEVASIVTLEDKKPPARDEKAMLADVLEYERALYIRSEKMMKVLDRLHQVLLGQKVPLLAELRKNDDVRRTGKTAAMFDALWRLAEEDNKAKK